MKTAYLLIGTSGSGKSTMIEQLKLDHEGQDIGVFSLDTCRLAYYAWHGDSGKMAGRPQLRFMHLNLPTGRDEMLEFYRSAFDYCNEAGADFSDFVTSEWIYVRDNNDVVIVDNTNLTRKQRSRWVSELRNSRTAEFHIVAIEFLVPLDTLIQRQSTRQDKSIPLSAVKQQYFRQEAALLGSECDEVRVVSSADSEVKGDSEEMNKALKSLNWFLNEQVKKQ